MTVRAVRDVHRAARDTTPLRLAPAGDHAFRALLRREETAGAWTVAAGGIALSDEIEDIWRQARRSRDCRTPAAWLMLSGAEAVGLIAYKSPPRKSADVEIGYGVAGIHRERGFATRAVAAVVRVAMFDARIAALTARTAFGNIASERVLSANRFAHIETRVEPELGAVRHWRLPLRDAHR